ncbi:MAG: DUF7064 domain-containing protein [Candidatus Helarchaeota archaeon]
MDDKEEYLHELNKTPFYRESYYFNFMDPENDIYCVQTMGFIPHERRTHYFGILYMDGKVKKFHANEVHFQDDEYFKMNPSDGVMSFNLLKPNEKWEISFKIGRTRELKYEWMARFPVYVYPSGGWNVPDILDQRHYEQSGIVKGTITLRNNESRPVNGLGHRDHSWGVRNWAHIKEWVWISAQFPDWAMNCWLNTIRGKQYLHGFISKASGNTSIVKAKIDTDYSSKGVPTNSRFELEDSNGNPVKFTTSLKFLQTLPQKTDEGSCYIYETISKFKMDDTGEEGYGVVEYLKGDPSL